MQDQDPNNDDNREPNTEAFDELETDDVREPNTREDAFADDSREPNT